MTPDFLQFLVQKNLLTPQIKDEILKESEEKEKSIEEIILEKKIIKEEEYFKAKSDYLKIPLKKLEKEEIPKLPFTELPEEMVKTYKVIPLARKGSILEVGMVNPEDISASSALEFMAKRKGLDIKTFLIPLSNFREALKRYQSLKEEIQKAVEELKKREEVAREEKPKEEKIEAYIEEAPVSKIVGVILRHAVEGGASDIHIEPYGEQFRVRFRVDGILYSSLFLDKKLLPAVVSRIKIMANLRIDETRIPQDGRFHQEIAGRKIDFRVATLPTPQGEKVAIRVLDPEKAVKSLPELGLSRRNLEIIKKAMRLPFGALVFCGPTGSGKSTTQYAILRELNTEKVNIISLEDPVEYRIKGINQSQIRPEIGYTFASGLRQILRQDPDIIMVGEVRDKETAELVTHAALTGHLVLYTIHANNAIGAIPRLLDLGVERYLIPATVKIVVSQRLVRTLCPHCKQKVKANKEERRIIEEEVEKLPESERKKVKLSDPLYIYKPKGCSECANRGTVGRIGIFEILRFTKQLEEIVLGDLSEAKLQEEARRQGMITLKQDGILKVLEGIVSLDEVLKVVELEEQTV